MMGEDEGVTGREFFECITWMDGKAEFWLGGRLLFLRRETRA
jgi:hypothetical protein